MSNVEKLFESDKFITVKEYEAAYIADWQIPQQLEIDYMAATRKTLFYAATILRIHTHNLKKAMCISMPSPETAIRIVILLGFILLFLMVYLSGAKADPMDVAGQVEMTPPVAADGKLKIYTNFQVICDGLSPQACDMKQKLYEGVILTKQLDGMGFAASTHSNEIIPLCPQRDCSGATPITGQ